MKLQEIAHDLFWWRHTAEGWRTVVTIYWPDRGQKIEARFDCCIFGDTGNALRSWTVMQPPGSFITIDSDDFNGENGWCENGVLSVQASELVVTDVQPETRLYGVVDWIHPNEGIASLHSDHCLAEPFEELAFTEIVVQPDQRNAALIFLTAPKCSSPQKLQLSVTNVKGQIQSTSVSLPCDSYQAHRIVLDDIFCELAQFSLNQNLSVSGHRKGGPMFGRPYLVSSTPAFSAYHGGDTYSSSPMMGIHHKFLGEGEVNPMLVVADEELQTEVTFFNTHGSLEEDFWIGVRLYDLKGSLIAHEPNWKLARRAFPTHGDFRELLGDKSVKFQGHAAFTFSEQGRIQYPRHVQALMGYRSHRGLARIMAWSDEWNTPVRAYKLRSAKGCYRSWFRILCKPYIENWFGITFAGSSELTGSCIYKIEIIDSTGYACKSVRELHALATDWARIEDLVPDSAQILQSCKTAIAVVESEADLACVAFTRHTEAGVWSGEHLMSAPVRTTAGTVWPAGC